jgi:hypothetical protein
MKPLYFFIILILATISFISCGEKKSAQDSSSMAKDTAASQEVAHVDYICPMDCEKGKTYHEMGKCPICKMDLIVKENAEHKDHDHKEGEGHEH